MARYMVAALIVVGLAVGIWWLMASDRPPTTTMPQAGTPTSTTVPAPATTTSTSIPTSTTSDTGHVVETIEEAEEILRELWFGWFEGIYNQDEDRIREVVATEELVAEARSRFGTVDFLRGPRASDISILDAELLRSDEACLAVWATLRLSGFLEGSSSSVHVLRWSGRWLSLSVWANREDLWGADCESSLVP